MRMIRTIFRSSDTSAIKHYKVQAMMLLIGDPTAKVYCPDENTLHIEGEASDRFDSFADGSVVEKDDNLDGIKADIESRGETFEWSKELYTA